MDIREQLAYACKILAVEGQNDMVWGHISARLPDRSGHLLMKPAGLGFDEVGPDDLLLIDENGQKISGPHPRHSEVFIHTEILRARPDVHCVIHTHAPHAVVFGATGQTLQAVGHHGVLFTEGLPVFTDTPDLISTPALGQAVARTLGQSPALLLRNHGIVAVGPSIPRAVFTAVLLEKACRFQLLAQAGGGLRHFPDAVTARQEYEHMYGPATENPENAFAYYVRRLQAWERFGLPLPGFGYPTL